MEDLLKLEIKLSETGKSKLYLDGNRITCVDTSAYSLTKNKDGSVLLSLKMLVEFPATREVTQDENI